MRQSLLTGLLWFSAIGCGLIGGIYFAFSAFVMTSFGRIGQDAGIAAMNAINVDIVRSLFMPFFFGTSLSCAALVVMGLGRWGEAGAVTMTIGAIVFLLGMTVVTMAFNVPLNDALAAVHPGTPEAAALWRRYLRDWTLWNHVRTIASIYASALFIAAIAAR